MKEKLLVITTIVVSLAAIIGLRVWRNAERHGYDVLSAEGAKDAAILAGLVLVLVVITALSDKK